MIEGCTNAHAMRNETRGLDFSEPELRNYPLSSTTEISSSVSPYSS